MRIESERLSLRPFQEGDEGHIWMLHQEEDIMRHTRRGRALSREESDESLVAYMKNKIWAAFSKSDAIFVGWFGFWESDEFSGEPELGFMIRKDLWNQGYTTEAAAAVLSYYKKPRVHALTAQENLASQKVLDKLGFELLSEDEKSKHFIKVEAD